MQAVRIIHIELIFHCTTKELTIHLGNKYVRNRQFFFATACDMCSSSKCIYFRLDRYASELRKFDTCQYGEYGIEKWRMVNGVAVEISRNCSEMVASVKTRLAGIWLLQTHTNIQQKQNIENNFLINQYFYVYKYVYRICDRVTSKKSLIFGTIWIEIFEKNSIYVNIRS